MGLHVVENAEQPVNRDRQNAVERKEIGRERNPKIGSIGDDVAPVASNAESAYPAAH